MAHYNRGEVSCLEAMESAFGKADVASYCAVNAFKYVWRMSVHEDGLASNAEKAIWFFEKVIAYTKQDGTAGITPVILYGITGVT